MTTRLQQKSTMYFLAVKFAACEAESRKYWYVLANFLQNPNFNLKSNYMLRETNKQRFTDVLSKRKYYKLFTHESNTISFK